MSEIIPIANFRTRVEAELAARLLEGAAVPYVLNSLEGIQAGPIAPGATLLVRAEDVELAREALAGEVAKTRPRIARVATCPDAEAAGRVRSALHAAGIPAFSTATGARAGAVERHAIFVPAVHAARGRRTIQTAMLEP